MKCKNLVAKYCAIDNRGYPKNEHELLKLILLVSASHHWLIKSPFAEGDQWWVGLTPKGVTGWNGRPDIYVSAPTLTDAICKAVILMGKAPNIDTNYGWLRVVETRPFSYEWLDHVPTILALAVKPSKTSLALVVKNITIWLTSILNLINQIPFRLAGN